MTSLLSNTLFTIVFCSQEDNGSKWTFVYRRNSWRSAQFSFTSACLHVTLLARVGWRVDSRDTDSFSIWKESCPGRGGVMEGNDIIHLEFICYSPEEKKKNLCVRPMQRATILSSEKSNIKKQSDCDTATLFSCSQIQETVFPLMRSWIDLHLSDRQFLWSLCHFLGCRPPVHSSSATKFRLNQDLYCNHD